MACSTCTLPLCLAASTSFSGVSAADVIAYSLRLSRCAPGSFPLVSAACFPLQLALFLAGLVSLPGLLRRLGFLQLVADAPWDVIQRVIATSVGHLQCRTSNGCAPSLCTRVGSCPTFAGQVFLHCRQGVLQNGWPLKVASYWQLWQPDLPHGCAAGLPWSVISSTLKLTSFSVQFTFIHEFHSLHARLSCPLPISVYGRHELLPRFLHVLWRCSGGFPLSPWHTGPLLSRWQAVPLQLFCTVSLFPCFPAISRTQPLLLDSCLVRRRCSGDSSQTFGRLAFSIFGPAEVRRLPDNLD